MHVRTPLRAGMRATVLVALAAVLAACGSSTATPSSSATGTITAKDPWVKTAASGMTAAFVTLVNDSGSEDVLVSAASSAAGMVQLHEMVMQDGQMVMQEKKGGIPVPAKGLRQADELAYATRHVTVQNHSYGIDIENYYGAGAMAYDNSVATYPGLLHVFSAGNDGAATSVTGAYAAIPGFANLTGNFKMAKNVLTVGLVDSFGQVFSYSSRGPSYDGRIKPDMVAFGSSGTSEAAALVSGAAALVQEAYLERTGTPASAALVRAVLLNSADDIPPAGPDYTSGFGSLNLKKALQIIEDQNIEQASVNAGATRTFLLDVPPGNRYLKVMLAWDDPPAKPNAAKALLNDLDLKVTRESDGTFWWGNNGLDAGNVSTAGGVANDRDTTEQVWLANPQPGIYLVEVMAPTIVVDGHVETPALDVDYALVMHPIDDGYQSSRALTVDLQSNTPGDLTVSLAPVPPIGWTEGFTFFSVTTSRPRGFGNFFGLEQDFLVDISLAEPAVAGGILHFTNSGTGNFPFAPFTFPPTFTTPTCRPETPPMATFTGDTWSPRSEPA